MGNDPSSEYSVVLYPNYPSSESLISNVATPFGERFGLTLQVSHGPWFVRYVSCMELRSCYSVEILSLREPSILLGMNGVVDTLILGCISHYLARCTSQSLQHIHTIHLSFASNDHTAAST